MSDSIDSDTHPEAHRRGAPSRAFMAAFDLGYRDYEIATQLHEMSCTDPGYEELQDEACVVRASVDSMDAAELRAYILGLHEGMGIHPW